MEEKLKKARKLVNKIVKNLGRNDLDWTVQLSINSTRPERINYCAQIEAPANGLQPITWVYDSYEELIENLKLGVKGLDPEAVERAWHTAEIQRAEALIRYHEEALKADEEKSEEDLNKKEK